MLSMFIGCLGAIVGLVGWFCYHSSIALVIGFILYCIETIMQWNELNTNAKISESLIILIGCIVGIFVKTPWYICGMLAITIYNGIMSVPALFKLGTFLAFIIKNSKH